MMLSSKGLENECCDSYDSAHSQSLDSSLCPECRAITLQPSTKPRLIREYANNKALHESAQQCTICMFILQRNEAQDRVQFTADDRYGQANVDAPIKLFQIFGNGQYNLEWAADARIKEFGTESGTYYYEIFGGLVADDVPGIGKIVSGRKVEDSAQGIQNLQRARTWLYDCLHSHPECETGPPCLPTRVIEVGSANGKPRLLITDHKPRHSYVALSYRWGKSPNLCLTADTLADFQRSIPFEKMPKTVQDAVVLSRELGIQYLWVDALCIIQDSAEDWAHESAMMGNIYSDATLVIKGASGTDCQDGLYTARLKDKLAPFKLRMSSKTGSMNFVQLRLESLLIREPLDSRGWCLQESWLARRMLVFGTRQIWWECRTCTLTESGSPLLDGKLGPAPFHKPIHGIPKGIDSSNTDNVGSDPGQNARYSWEDVVEGLSSCSFTYPDDNLAALSGIAKLFATSDHDEDTYTAGLWKSRLPQNLLWLTFPHKSDESETGRPVTWHAPSWTWASLSGFAACWIGIGRKDTVRASVLSYETTLRGSDVHGKVHPHGFIKLRTQLKPAYRSWSEGANALVGWFLTAQKPELPRPTDDFFKILNPPHNGTIGRCRLDWRDVDEDIREPYLVYFARITTTRGLFLEKINERGDFRRRGVIEMWEGKEEEWWGDCEAEIVTIF